MNLMDLFIKVGVKDEASSQIKKITSAAGNTFKTIAKISGVALTAAATGVAVLTKQAVSSYAEYEQLVGGINKLFGEGSAKLQSYASEAYKYAGMSANEYMQNVTGFSAALINSLGGDTDKAADIANIAMKDIADNANTFGKYTAQELAGVYQALAKGQYQTLDNLNLGYGGTKEGMQQLIDKANELRAAQGLNADLTIDSYADIVLAIHEVQHEMGIMDTTANEAAGTISGSLQMLKASWQDLLTGLADPNADLNTLFDHLVESAEAAFINLIPAVKRALTSIGKLVSKLAPTLAKELPGLMTSLLPDLITAAEGLLAGLAEALPEIVGVLLDNLPAIASALVNVAGKLFDAIVEVVPELLGKVWTAIDTAISNSSFGERWKSIKEAVKEAVDGIAEAWGSLKEKAKPLIDKIGELWQKFKDWEEENHILEGAIGLVGTVIEGLVLTLGDIVGAFEAALDAGKRVADALKNAWQPVADFFSGLSGTIASITEANYQGAQNTLGSIPITGFAIGNDYVPYNGYVAQLHRGEAVLTAREAEEWRRGNNGRQVVNNFTFNGVSQSDLDFIVDYVNRGLA